MLALTGSSPGGGCGDAARSGHGREEAAPEAAPALPGETIALRAAGGDERRERRREGSETAAEGFP